MTYIISLYYFMYITYKLYLLVPERKTKSPLFTLIKYILEDRSQNFSVTDSEVL